jgi:hypothetical protein
VARARADVASDAFEVSPNGPVRAKTGSTTFGARAIDFAKF